jgi:hypothetical protein
MTNASRAAVFVICVLSPTALRAADSLPDTRDAASREAIQRDWILQDYARVTLAPELEQPKDDWRKTYLKSLESQQDDPVLPRLVCFVSRDGSDTEQRMLARVLEDLTDSAADEIRQAGDALIGIAAPGSDPRWKQLYLQACESRRARRLEPLVARWRRFVFDEHQHPGPSWKYTEVLSEPLSNRHRAYRPGASLKVLELDGIYGRVQPLLQTREGILRNPDVSYDGQRILFAWKKSDRGDDFHLYEMDMNSGAVRQLTDEPGCADYEGVYLPDGNILFSSTRCSQTVDCNWVEVSNLYLMDGDGRFVRRVGFDQVHTILPTVTDDGRVLYTRWEYNDRGQIFPQPLFQMNPDGTNQQEFYGGNSWFPTNIIHARKIPGSRKVLAVVTGHHRPPHGKLAIIDPALGRQEGDGIQLLAPVRAADYQRVDHYAADGNQFQYPYPVDEDHFLVTLAVPTPAGTLGRFDIYFMDRDGRRELLVEGSGPGETLSPRQILPLAARPMPHVRPTTVDYRKTTGTFYLQDVYQGLAVRGVPRGTVKQLRVVGLEYRCAAIGNLSQQGLGGSSEVTTPVAVGNGSWDVKVVFGTTPVYEDGSAMFQAPARVPLYFQALDERGDAIQTMRSWATLMPGETQSCVGCHEHKNSVPRAAAGMSLAMQAGPQRLVPFAGPARGFSFAREVQPILDQHCVRCHTGEADKPLNLTAEAVLVGTTKRRFSQSYLTLTHTGKDCGNWNHDWVNWIDCMSEPALLPPYSRGAATSKLMTLLRGGHEDVTLTRQELETIACWIDLLVPFCGDYREANAWSQGDLDLYARAEAKRRQLQEAEEAGIRVLIEQRNGSQRQLTKN